MSKEGKWIFLILFFIFCFPILFQILPLSLFIIAIIIFLFAAKEWLMPTKSFPNKTGKYRIITDENLTTLGLESKEELIQELFPVLNKYLLTYSKGDIEALKECCADLVFTTSKHQLEKHKNKQRINDIKYIDSTIYDVKMTKENIKIYAAIKIEYNEIEETSTSKKNTLFEGTFKGQNFIENIENCPNCGAPLKEKTSKKCDYCNQKLNDKNWKLVELKKQKEEVK